jgi:hypothetical protein
MAGFLPYCDPAMDYDMDAIRLGMLTYRGVVKDSMQRKRKILFTCDCGRVVIVPIPHLAIVETSSKEVIDGIPWSCGECGAREVGPKRKPWGMKYHHSNWRSGPMHRGLRVRKRKAESHCAKHLHKPEWFAWQQAKRISKGVVARWKNFHFFYKDMGDRPSGARLAKHDKSKPHGPQNSYWQVLDRLRWGDQPVHSRWVTNNFGVPGHYIRACKKGGVFDVKVIVAMHQGKQPPPKPLGK